MQYRTLQKINRDGQIIAPGELIDLAESDANQLLEMKAIEPAPRRFSREIVVPGTPD